ncbi:MAG: serine protease [Paracoccaceae bacterium]
MRPVVWLAALIFAALIGRGASAQDSWLQIEAQPSLAEAESRAQAYTGVFPNVAGFRLTTGWYGIALGPYSPQDAQDQLALLKREGLIPQDSYIPEPGRYGERFWPRDGAAAAATATVPESGAGTPTEPAAGTETAAAEPTGAALPEESPSEARAAEAALPLEDREALQEALKWQGFYAGKIDGAIGPGTRGSMAAWQASRGYEETGVLTTRQRQELVGGWRAEVAALGFRPVREEEAGIEITLPMNLVKFGRYQPPFVQYDETGGSGVRVLLISQEGDAAALFGLYDLMQTLEIVPLQGERERRDTSFVLTGKNDKVQSYTQAELAGGFVKGFTLVWRPEDGERAIRIAETMKASFAPFGDRALDDSLGEPLAEDKAGLLAGLEVRKPRITRSGFFADATGTVVTAAEAVAGCGRVTIADGIEADTVLADSAAGIAILKPRAPLAPAGFAMLQSAPVRPNAEIAVAGFPYGDRLPEPVANFGTLAEAKGLRGEPDLIRLTLNGRPGEAGGPVLDNSGGVVGMLLPKLAGGSEVLPDDVAFALGATAIGRRLAEHQIAATPATPDGALAAEDLTARARAMTVMVACWD